MSETEGHQRFWAVAEPFLARDGVTKSTMMGFPCLRVNGDFFASVHKDGTGLVVKLSKQRVSEAIEAGQGESFAPNGKVFKEWMFVPLSKADSWPGWVDEALAFVSG